MQFWHWTIVYYVAINIMTFILYGVDKKKAKNHKWRVSEFTLIALAMTGGCIGAIAGMFVWHHKTKKTKFRILVPLSLLLHIFLVCFLTYQNNHLVVTNYSYKTDINCRIVQISDVHNMVPYWDDDALARKVAEQNPDYIVITGDLVDSTHPDIDSAIRTAESLAKITDTYYVTGNHEKRFSEAKQAEFLQSLRDVGVIVLQDEYVLLTDNSGREFVLAGMDNDSIGTPAGYALIESFPEQTVSILLAHQPQYIYSGAYEGADIVLSGHLHGGQIVFGDLGNGMPNNRGTGLISPEFVFFQEFSYGFMTERGTAMYTSRGIGNSIIPWRINNYPEIVVLTLHS